MGIKSDIYRSALRDYDAIKSASEAVRREMKNKVYSANPRLEEIDREMNGAGVAAAKKIIKNPVKMRVSRLLICRQRIEIQPLQVHSLYIINQHKEKRAKGMG